MLPLANPAMIVVGWTEKQVLDDEKVEFIRRE